MNAGVEMFPVALIGLGFLLGLAVAMIFAQAYVTRLKTDLCKFSQMFLFWKNECSILSERYQAADEAATANASLVATLREKLEESGISHLEDNWWREGRAPFGGENNEGGQS